MKTTKPTFRDAVRRKYYLGQRPSAPDQVYDSAAADDAPMTERRFIEAQLSGEKLGAYLNAGQKAQGMIDGTLTMMTFAGLIQKDEKVLMKGPCYIGEIMDGADVMIIGGPAIITGKIGDNAVITMLAHEDQNPQRAFAQSDKLEPQHGSFSKLFNSAAAGVQRKPRTDRDRLLKMQGLECRDAIGDNVTITCHTDVNLGKGASDIRGLSVVAGGNITHLRGGESSILHDPVLCAGANIDVDTISGRVDLQAKGDIKIDFVSSGVDGAKSICDADHDIHVRDMNKQDMIYVAGGRFHTKRSESAGGVVIYNDKYSNNRLLRQGARKPVLVTTNKYAVTEIDSGDQILKKAYLQKFMELSQANAVRGGILKASDDRRPMIKWHHDDFGGGYRAGQSGITEHLAEDTAASDKSKDGDDFKKKDPQQAVRSAANLEKDDFVKPICR